MQIYVDCRRNRLVYKRQRHLQLFLASRTLEFVAIDILGSLQTKSAEIRFVVLIKNCYFKVTRHTQTKTISASQTAIFSINILVKTYGIAEFSLTKNGLQLISKFVKSMCLYIRTKLQTTRLYHPQRIEKTEWYRKTHATWPSYTLKEHKTDRDVLFQP